MCWSLFNVDVMLPGLWPLHVAVFAAVSTISELQFFRQ